MTYGESPDHRSFKGAVFGAIVGVLIIALHGLIDFGDLIRNPTQGARWSQLAMLAAGGVGGAFLGALVPVFENRRWALVTVIPIAGALAGTIYWYILQPDDGPLTYVVIGLMVSIIFAFVGWLQARR